MNDKIKPKVLVVDDERTNILALAQILTPEYDVIIAIDGSRAIAAAKKHIPNLILLDIILPDMSGFEIISKLRDDENTKAIPVIFITGLDNSATEEKGFFMGAVDYITKPFNNSIVRARVNTHLKMADYIQTIERLCMLDILTELPNRRAFDKHINFEWGRAIREQIPLSILMIDVDKFKAYNDTFGHPEGDILLKGLSDLLMQTMRRSTDFIARWGGEEFIASLSNTDLNGALSVAEELRNNVVQAGFPSADSENGIVTVSIGVASSTPVAGDSIANIISLADKALYVAKNNGRDRVCSNP